MAKRFIDTKIWDTSGCRNLKSRQKLLWFYLMTKCDHAGILDADFVAASFFIGEKVTEEDIEWMKDRLVPLTSNNGQQQYFIPSFIDYQYGYLKETSKPHLSVRKRLTDKGLEKFINKGLKNISKGYLTLKDKDKDKDKAKDKNKDKGKPENLEEVRKYFIDKGIANPVTNADKFYSHYESVNWFRGKTKIKNWKMCTGTWNFDKGESNAREKMSIRES